MHSFVFLFLSILIMVAMVFPGLEDHLQTAGFFVTLWYIYRSVRVVYQNSRKRTALKLTVLSFAYSLLLVTSIVTVMFATFLMM